MEDQEDKNNGRSSSNSSESSEKNRGKGKKIRIKFRILKEEAENDERGEEKKRSSRVNEAAAAEAKGQQRICFVCNKGFVNGKALGGHMRIHVQANNNGGQSSKPNKTHLKKLVKKNLLDHPGTLSNSKEIFNNHGNPSSVPDETERPICSVCNKDFPSRKSLFGHMRCHPERDWRGIQPPSAGTAPRNSSSPTVSDPLGCRSDDPIGMEMEADCSGSNLCSSLPVGWSVTGKRGRQSKEVMSSGLNDNLVPKVAYDLMMLAQGRSQNAMTKLRMIEEYSKAGKGKIEDKNGGAGSIISPRKWKKLRLVDNGNGSSSDIMEKRKGKVVLKDGSSLNIAELDSDDEYWLKDHFLDEDLNSEHRQSIDEGNQLFNENSKLCSFDQENMKTHVHAADHDNQIQGQSPVGTFKCSTRKKTFPTHQALGRGHRSRHCKETTHNTNFLDESESVNGSAADETEAKEFEDGGSGVGPPLHKRKICPKTFFSDHWGGSVEPPVSQDGSPGAGSQTSRKGFGLDLNHPPMVEEEDDFQSSLKFP
ncbi:hypothetical protein Ancab_024572 [Ancistrocladus abbreviatus]